MLRLAVMLCVTLFAIAPRAGAVCDTSPAPPPLGPLGYNVKDPPFNAVGNGKVDDRASIQLAIDCAELHNYNTALGAQVYLPPGVYKVADTLTIKYHKVKLAGAGAFTTTIRRGLIFTAGDTVRIAAVNPNPNEFLGGTSVSGIRFEAGGATTAGAHLNLINVQHASFTDLQLHGQFGGLRIEGGLTLAFTNVDVFTDNYFSSMLTDSYLVKLDPSTNNIKNPTDIHFNGGNWRSHTGLGKVEYGLRVHASDAVYFSNIHVLGAGKANVLITPAPTFTGEQITGLRFSNCWFDAPAPDNAVNVSEAAVWIQDLVPPQPPGFKAGLITFDSCMFWGGGGGPGQQSKIERGVLVNWANLKGLVISDSTIHGYRSHGVHLAAGSNVLLSGNQISNNRDGGSFGVGIMVEPGVSDFQILNNTIGPNLVTFTTQHTFGIYIASGSSNRYSIVGNVILNLPPGSPAIVDNGAGPTKLLSANLQ